MRIPALMIVLILQCAANTKKKGSKVTVETTGSDSEIDQLRQMVADLSKQVMKQQLHVEEKTRTEGYSGIKLVRGINKGLKNYASNTHLAPAVFSIHDHSNYDRTVGIGEFAAVLNGVDFRTRHNDYKLVMPSRTSTEYHAYEDIPFPEVPPEVLKQKTVEDQVLEMTEWFKAFNNQDRSERDYTKYFKPVLCYLEGTWTLDKDLEEPFPSDRHQLEAKSWDDLHEQNRFATYTGTKHRLENVAYLPTAIVSVNMTTGEAVYGQWNYRIVCHPIGYDIPLHFFHQEDDLSFRVHKGQTMAKTAQTRAARFKLFDPSRKTNFQILDSIFAEIPGKDNYGANLTMTAFADEMYATDSTDNSLMNLGYYHRSYKTQKSGAGGITYTALGFNDDNLFVALTTQPRVAPLETDQCHKMYNKFGRLATRCSRDEVRASYAIPLEVIFMTPLLTWNPYNIVFHDDTETAIKDGRNGGKPDKALNGIDKIHYYKTPKEFFSGPLDVSDPSDTVKSYIYVSGPDGEAKQVSSSGTRILLQNIGGEDKIRLRFLIAPVFYEGSSVWKELNALKDNADANGVPSSVVFEMSVTVQDPPGEHTHEFSISYEDFSLLLAGDKIQVITEEAQEHTHELTIVYDFDNKSFRYISCSEEVICWDGHPPPVILETKNEFTRLD